LLVCVVGFVSVWVSDELFWLWLSDMPFWVSVVPFCGVDGVVVEFVVFWFVPDGFDT
jgi:hypothetical protein